MNPHATNHYATLGLGRRCTAEQIRIAWRVLARKHHPDLNNQAPEAVARTQAINEAYEVLSDPARKRAYDEELAASEEQPAKRRTSSATTSIKQDVQLRIQELLRGTTLNVQVRDPANTEGPESYELVIPPDTAPGTRFRVKRAAPHERGFVIVRVKVRPDHQFKPRGSDLRCDLKISTQRATQGGSESVRGPTGNFARVQIPPRVARNEIIRVPGEGLPKSRGGRGDLLVRITYRPEVRITRA